MKPVLPAHDIDLLRRYVVLYRLDKEKMGNMDWKDSSTAKDLLFRLMDSNQKSVNLALAEIDRFHFIDQKYEARFEENSEVHKRLTERIDKLEHKQLDDDMWRSNITASGRVLSILLSLASTLIGWLLGHLL